LIAHTNPFISVGYIIHRMDVKKNYVFNFFSYMVFTLFLL